MFSSTSTSSIVLFQHLSSNLHIRRLLLDSPQRPSAITPSPSLDQNLPSGIYVAARRFDSNVVMVLSVLLCALICSLGLNSIIRCALRCSSLARASNNSENISAQVANTNTGIKRKALKAFTTVTYSADLKLPGLVAADCVICLSEFSAGERLRLLPKCNHGFHLRCIDRWLVSHSSCPTCRDNLMETCQKIVGCHPTNSSQPPRQPQPAATQPQPEATQPQPAATQPQPAATTRPQPVATPPSPPQETAIYIMPLQREDVHDYRGSSLN